MGYNTPEKRRAYVNARRARLKAEGVNGYCDNCKKPLGRNHRGNKTKVCQKCLWGERHHLWVGHGFHNADGYVVIRIGKKQTILEHRHVMQQHLGRNLYADETVHHINGKRDDNRIENLELWVGAPTRGIRSVDAVKWAKEIIQRYEGSK